MKPHTYNLAGSALLARLKGEKTKVVVSERRSGWR